MHLTVPFTRCALQAYASRSLVVPTPIDVQPQRYLTHRIVRQMHTPRTDLPTIELHNRLTTCPLYDTTHMSSSLTHSAENDLLRFRQQQEQLATARVAVDKGVGERVQLGVLRNMHRMNR